MTNPDEFWPAALSLAIAIAFVTIAVVLWLRRRARLGRARTWPSVAGQVDSTAVRLEKRGDQQSVHVAEVSYSYTVLGESCSGRLRRTFILYGSANKWVAGYASGHSLTIRHNPDDASDSVLFEDEQSKGMAA